MKHLTRIQAGTLENMILMRSLLDVTQTYIHTYIYIYAYTYTCIYIYAYTYKVSTQVIRLSCVPFRHIKGTLFLWVSHTYINTIYAYIVLHTYLRMYTTVRINRYKHKISTRNVAHWYPFMYAYECMHTYTQTLLRYMNVCMHIVPYTSRWSTHHCFHVLLKKKDTEWFE